MEDFLAIVKSDLITGSSVLIECLVCHLLANWHLNGVPAQTHAPPWSLNNKQARMDHGCHKSTTDHGEFL